MKATDRGGDAGLLDLTSLSLGDLLELDESVVANAIRRLMEDRRDGAEYPTRFDAFNSSL